MATIKLMMLDDHDVVRFGLLAYLKELADIEVVGSFPRVVALMQALKQQAVDVVLVDYVLSQDEVDGLSLVQSISGRFPDCKILVVSASEMPVAMSLLKRAGAKGFISKSQPLDVLARAIRQVAYGYEFWLNTMGDGVLPEREIDSLALSLQSMLDGLSPREREVIRCYAEGMTITEIAHKFSRSIKTISTQKQVALRKMGLKSDRELFILNSNVNR